MYLGDWAISSQTLWVYIFNHLDVELAPIVGFSVKRKVTVITPFEVMIQGHQFGANPTGSILRILLDSTTLPSLSLIHISEPTRPY